MIRTITLLLIAIIMTGCNAEINEKELTAMHNACSNSGGVTYILTIPQPSEFYGQFHCKDGSKFKIENNELHAITKIDQIVELEP